MTRSLAAGIGLSLVLTSTAHDTPSQLSSYERDSLLGVRGISILVENLDSDAQVCNVRRSDLELSAARSVLDANVRVGDGKDVRDPMVIVQVEVMQVAALCIASVNLQATIPATAKLPHQAVTKDNWPERAVTVELWHDGSLLTGAPAVLGPGVNAAIRDHVSRFATKVKLANQK